MDKANEVMSERINAVKIDRAVFAERSEPSGQSAEYSVHILTCLLHYHERMTMGEVSMMKPDGTSMTIQSGTLFTGYAEALREAIRCIKEVHGIE